MQNPGAANDTGTNLRRRRSGAEVKKILLKACVLLLRLVYAPFRMLKKRDKITYISRQSDQTPLDFRILTERMRDGRPDVENVVLCRKLGGAGGHTLTYPFHMLRQFRHIATSKVVVLDGYCIAASVLPHDSETTIVQMWHAAAAIKKFGWQILDQPSGSSRATAEIMRMHRNYDYVTASSDAVAESFQKGFVVGPEQIRKIGMPHFSRLMQPEREKIAALKEAFPALKGRMLILYIPTFRKNGTVKLRELIDAVPADRYALAVRLHPLDRTEHVGEGVIYDRRFSTYDWMKASDLIITDYSSLAVEASLLGKPLYFYEYDLAAYSEDPGLNVDMRREALARYVFTDPGELPGLLEEEYDFRALEAFRDKYVEVDPAGSADAFAAFLTEMIGGKQ